MGANNYQIAGSMVNGEREASDTRIRAPANWIRSLSVTDSHGHRCPLNWLDGLASCPHNDRSKSVVLSFHWLLRNWSGVAV